MMVFKSECGRLLGLMPQPAVGAATARRRYTISAGKGCQQLLPMVWKR